MGTVYMYVGTYAVQYMYLPLYSNSLDYNCIIES